MLRRPTAKENIVEPSALAKDLSFAPRLWQLMSRRSITKERNMSRLLEKSRVKTDTSVYVSRSVLEELTLFQARTFVWGIKSIVIDYAKSDADQESNWVVIGFASGSADRDEASRAIALAVRRYGLCVLVEDTDPRADFVTNRGRTAGRK